MHRVYYIMGVSGSGKTTTGRLLGEKMGVPFYDGDDFHPAKNIRKMSSGVPLTDDDRYEWLLHINEFVKEKMARQDLIMACSALKEKYREILRRGIDPNCQWIYLKGNLETISRRLSRRKDHFMPAELLISQLETLEEPAYGLHVELNDNADKMVELILNSLSYEI